MDVPESVGVDTQALALHHVLRAQDPHSILQRSFSQRHAVLGGQSASVESQRQRQREKARCNSQRKRSLRQVRDVDSVKLQRVHVCPGQQVLEGAYVGTSVENQQASWVAADG